MVGVGFVWLLMIASFFFFIVYCFRHGLFVPFSLFLFCYFVVLWGLDLVVIEGYLQRIEKNKNTCVHY